MKKKTKYQLKTHQEDLPKEKRTNQRKVQRRVQERTVKAAVRAVVVVIKEIHSFTWMLTLEQMRKQE